MSKTEADTLNAAARNEAERLTNIRVMTDAENAAMTAHFNASHARGEHIVMTAEQVALKRAYWQERNRKWAEARRTS